MKSVYSSSEHVIYNAVFYADYQLAGTWPSDGIEISDDDAITFSGQNQPTGQVLDYKDGKLQWIVRSAPVLSEDEYIAIAEQKKGALISTGSNRIVVWQTKLLMGRKLTDDETRQLNAWLDYLDAVVAIKTETAPNIKWPVSPEEQAS